MKRLSLMAFAPLLVIGTPALAHPEHAGHGSVMAGFVHPFAGMDHVLAMAAVGLWAATLGGRALVAVPATFVGVMMLGFVAALAGVTVPFVEPMILSSVVALGLLIAIARQVPVVAAAGIVGLVAFFHGHAHGVEMAGDSALSFGVGFALATMLLHAAGLGLGLGAARVIRGPTGVRIAGAATALGGVLLLAN
ncbi:HupE/UreJ family protein [Neorhizobium alkalisoli]|uniref:Urease accessory protein n=1 Tax=Neorhizobium alkalisoli TaxID=528178 RepID=A0A561QAH5_9HYPH|nr:HupE/UreJ family protein [Neorhizobium alkalisoli]TWF47368.1 urease accessory protein [Neorhizobium alkalisoli]